MAWIQYPETPDYKQYVETMVEARRTAIVYLEAHPKVFSLPIFENVRSRKPKGWVAKDGNQYVYSEEIKSYGRTMYTAKPLYKNGKIRRE